MQLAPAGLVSAAPASSEMCTCCQGSVMPADVQSMLHDLRERLSSFQDSLPDDNRADAPDGLRVIKGALVGGWEAQEPEATRRRSLGPSPREWSIAYAAYLFFASLIVGFAITQAFWNALVFAMAATVVSTPVLYLVYRWLSWPSRYRSGSRWTKKLARLESDSGFLIDEVRDYIQDQIRAADRSFAAARNEIEEGSTELRQTAERTLLALRQEREDALQRRFPDSEKMLREVDEQISACARVVNMTLDEGDVISQLRVVDACLQALHAYAAQLEGLKGTSPSQTAGGRVPDGISGEADPVGDWRSTTLVRVVSQLGELRRDVERTRESLRRSRQ